MMNLICLMDHIWFQINKITLNTSLISSNYETITNNYPVKIYVNRIKNRIDFKVKTGYKLKLLSPETMKLLGSTSDQDKDEENKPKLESVEVNLVHCNLVNNNY